MVTAGEGAPYEQGGGGKFRKKPLRRGHTTPYDRPALVNPRNGWLSKLVVDPASKLISASAHLFFSSVFPKLLPPPPPPPPGANHEPRDTLQVAEVEVPNILTGKIELATNDGGDPVNSTEGSGISELEQMLKQKTFTRYEIDRLTELLQSRTTDLLVEGEDKSVEPNLPKPVSGFERLELFTSSIPKENGIQSHILHEAASTPVASARFLEEDVASPAELAKAYMGSRPSKVSPSLLGLRSQALKEDVTLLDNVPFPSKSPVMSLEPKSAVRGGFPDNGFLTPRTRGRSAIYSMARTPYSRVYLAANQKGAGPSSSSSSRFALQHDDNDGRFGSKQEVLKRRSSVFDDDDIGSVGPIRRIRQKTNLLSPKSSNLPVIENPLSSHRMEIGSNSTREKLLLFDKPKHKVSKILGEGDNIIRDTSYAFVPSKSTETATKILQHLERLTPKKKSPESKFTKLTPGMLSEKALITLEDGDSSKFLQNVQDSRKLEFSRSINSGDPGESASQKQDKIEENGTKTLVNPSDTLVPAVNKVDTAIPAKNPAPTFKNAGSVSANFVSQPPQRRSAFQMSAHEDYLELDHDVHSNGDASKLPAEEKEKLEMPLTESSATVIEAVMVGKSRDFPEVKSPAVSQLNKRTDLEIKYGFMAGENKSTSTFDKISQPKEPNVSPPLFSFGPKHVDKTPTFKFPTSPSLHESPLLKSSASSDPKPESSNSFPTVVLDPSDAVTKIPESDNGDNSNTQKEREIPKKPVTVVSPAVSTSTSKTSNIFSFGAPAGNSNSNNGSLASSSYIFSSSAPVPLSNGLATTTAATITASSGICTSSTTTPTFSAAPIFGFGSSVASSSVSTASTTPDVQNTNAKVNTVKETNFGSPFGGSFSATASTGNGIFGFGTSATSSTDNNQPQSFLFGTGCGSITQTMPVQFGSSNSAPGFGSIGATLSSSNSLFGSSTPATNMFSSVTSFGTSSSAASSEINSVSSSSDVSSSLFGSSWQSNKSPVFGASSGGSLFNSTSPSTGFAFGASSVSSIFSFTSAAANTSSLTSFSQTQPVFGNSTPVFTASPGNNDQMSMEDSMAEDPVMTSTQSVPQVFSQPSIITPSAGFVSSAPSAGIPFQFSSQQSQAAPQNPSPFASGSLDFSAGGSFSLGSGGGDKANRKIIRVKKTRKK